MIPKRIKNGIEILTLENDHLIASITPTIGGKITSVFNKHLQKEFLWTNAHLPLQINPPGADYDANFFGAIDELIPNDIPETIDGITYPDHGELWTTALQYQEEDGKITVSGRMELSGLHYSKTVYLDADRPVITVDYKITNETAEQRSFLWKLHAALRIQPGDKLMTAAKYGQVIDPAYSRFTDLNPFKWPFIQYKDASMIPPLNNTMDFFYLYDILDGEMQLLSGGGEHLFSYRYDTKIFPYQWYFASYGGFLDHYTAILEPSTNMPMSVNEAKEKRQCAVLESGKSLTTTVIIYAGEKNGYIK